MRPSRAQQQLVHLVSQHGSCLAIFIGGSRVKSEGAALDDIFAVRGGIETPERIRSALGCLFVAKHSLIPFLCRL